MRPFGLEQIRNGNMVSNWYDGSMRRMAPAPALLAIRWPLAGDRWPWLALAGHGWRRWRVAGVAGQLAGSLRRLAQARMGSERSQEGGGSGR